MSFSAKKGHNQLLSVEHFLQNKSLLLRVHMPSAEIQFWKNTFLKKMSPKQFSWTVTKNNNIVREFVQQVAGEDGGDGGGGGRICPEHPSPILHAPRDNISRKGNPSLRPISL